ncbi:hypothetical protein [Saccharopolyspora flava]|uniref:hypothetical protein n=1 Tax=Saccharopolyspora flava TaxID=95161 RepID=UPI001114FE11|nr:hypothetical protein [Saccharopolyspora flava]
MNVIGIRVVGPEERPGAIGRSGDPACHVAADTDAVHVTGHTFDQFRTHFSTRSGIDDPQMMYRCTSMVLVSFPGSAAKGSARRKELRRAEWEKTRPEATEWNTRR